VENLPFITKVGPMIAPGQSAQGPTTTIPFQIEAQTADGPMRLSLSPVAAEGLAEELRLYLKVHGSR
jgi:hypothetical protein